MRATGLAFQRMILALEEECQLVMVLINQPLQIREVGHVLLINNVAITPIEFGILLPTGIVLQACQNVMALINQQPLH